MSARHAREPLEETARCTGEPLEEATTYAEHTLEEVTMCAEQTLAEATCVEQTLKAATWVEPAERTDRSPGGATRGEAEKLEGKDPKVLLNAAVNLDTELKHGESISHFSSAHSTARLEMLETKNESNEDGEPETSWDFGSMRECMHV